MKHLTKNEVLTLKQVISDPDLSLRKLVKKLNLGGVASATWIINSLVKEGLIEKVGQKKNMKYRLTAEGKKMLPVSLAYPKDYTSWAFALMAERNY